MLSEKNDPAIAGEKNRKVVLVGAGHVATHLALAMNEAGFPIVQVFSRTTESARMLAGRLRCTFTCSTDEIRKEAGIYLFCVKDDILQEVVRKIPANKGLWIHTAGSVSMELFNGKTDRYGVIYPMQTLSKSRKIDFYKTPLFVEGNTPECQKEIRQVAERVSGEVGVMNSERRRYLHLAAVFACNFSNYMYCLATQVLEEQGINRQVLQPLIEETALRLRTMSPDRAQTGPAVRYDRKVMEQHLAMLKDAGMREIYEVVSAGIYEKSGHHNAT
jgi:predicted short-subunit dehydrogenase-like oxidoreductase (DUF2520 family)